MDLDQLLKPPICDSFCSNPPGCQKYTPTTLYPKQDSSNRLPAEDWT